MLSLLGKITAGGILKYFFLIFLQKIMFDIVCKLSEKEGGNFAQKIRFDSLCNLSPLETVCMKCPTLFSGQIAQEKTTAGNI